MCLIDFVFLDYSSTHIYICLLFWNDEQEKIFDQVKYKEIDF